MLLKDIDFRGSYIIFRFYLFTRTLARIYENRSWYLSEKSYNFWNKAAKAFKFCHFMTYMMHLKIDKLLRLSKKFSLCKIEIAAGGAKFHHHPRDRVIDTWLSYSVWWTMINNKWTSAIRMKFRENCRKPKHFYSVKYDHISIATLENLGRWTSWFYVDGYLKSSSFSLTWPLLCFQDPKMRPSNTRWVVLAILAMFVTFQNIPLVYSQGKYYLYFYMQAMTM